MKQNIQKETNLAELLDAHPEAAEMLLDYGLYCAGCMAAGFDTVEQGAQLHGMSEQEIQEMIDYLNDNLSKLAVKKKAAKTP